MKKLFVLLLTMALLCSCALAETVNAKDEAVLNIFTWEGYIDYETVIKPFEDETGIKINYATFASNEEMYEKLAAAKGGDYDIILASDYIMNRCREEGLMQKLDKSIVTNYGNLDEAFLGQFFDPENEYVFPYIAGGPLIIYNPDEVSVEIKGMKDLLDPSLVDSLGLIDDARVTIGLMLRSLGYSMNTTDEAQLAEAAAKLDEIKPNVNILEYENLHNFLLSGDISVAYTFTPFVALAMETNPDLKIVYPEEGLGFGVDGCFIPVNAPHAKNANLFIEYMLRPEVGAVITQWQNYCCTNVPAREILGDWYYSNPVFTGLIDRLDDVEYIKNLSTEDEQKFQDIWTKFKLSL